MAQHPLSQLFPPMTPDEFATLVADVGARGVVTPIVTIDGDQILDGWHRYEACRRLKIAAPTTEYAGDDPLGFVLSQNMARRHLSQSQRAAIAAQLIESGLLEGGLAEQTRTAAKLAGASCRSIDRARRVNEQAPEALQDVLAGRITLKAAAGESCGPSTDPAPFSPRGERCDKSTAPAESASLPARRQPPVDRFGHPLPDRLVALLHGEVAREMLSIQRELLQLARRAKRLAESSDPAAACLHRQVLPKAVMRAAKIISRTMPWIVCRPCEGAGTCPSCGGKGCDRCRGGERGACAVCRGRGWLSASEYSRLREPARWPDAPPTATPTHVPKIADLREAARAQGDDVHVRNSAAQERSNPSDRPGINSWPDLRPERIDPPSYAGDV